MSKNIDNLVESLDKVLAEIDSGTVNIYKLTEVLNDHVDRIVRLEQRVELLEKKTKNLQIDVDTIPGGTQKFYYP